jgi:hypothetical protein
MSVKEQLAEAIAQLPEDIELEEAVERIYRLIKLNRALRPTSLPIATGGDVFAFARRLQPGVRDKEDIDRQVLEDREGWERP